VFEAFTPQARWAVVSAQDEARALGHDTTLPEHLLLAIACASTPVADALFALGISPTTLRRQVTAQSSDHMARVVPLTSETEEALRQARVEAAIRRHHRIRTGHLLIALISTAHVQAIIRRVGSTADQVRLAVLPRLQFQER
jgi:ATP-dependent Clp protease ATP-binding subunit ClpC